MKKTVKTIPTEALKSLFLKSMVLNKKYLVRIAKLELKLKLSKNFCDVCWTSSWAPCEKGTPHAQKLTNGKDWVICQMCEIDRKTSYLVQRFKIKPTKQDKEGSEFLEK